MTGTFDLLLSRYGQSVTLTPRASGQPIALRAFLQPILTKQEDLPIAPSPLGAVSSERWLYLGSGSQPLAPGDQVDTEGLALVIQAARTVVWQDQPFYQRAMLRKRKEAAV